MPITLPLRSNIGPPELPGVDRRVGLDVAVVRARAADVAVQRRDDAGGDGAAEAERIADRDHPVADPRLRSNRRSGRTGRLVALILSTARSEAASRPTSSASYSVRSAEGDGDRLDRRVVARRRDDMVVGDDIAVGRDDEARAERAAALRDRASSPSPPRRRLPPKRRKNSSKPGGSLRRAVDLDALLGRDVDHRRLQPRGEVGEAHRRARARRGGGDRARLVLRGLRAERR